MAKVIVISNSKGGTGKSTLCMQFANYLAFQGKKVAVLDCDEGQSVMELRQMELRQSEDAIIPWEVYNATSNSRTFVERARTMGDVYVLVDCPPSLNQLTINALIAAESGVIIPVQSEYFALRGMTDLFKIINKVRRQINPTLKIDGALLTLVDKRTNLPKEIEKQIKDNYGSILKLYDTKIPRAVKTAESTSSGGSIFSYDKSGTVAEAYSSFAKEVLDDGKRLVKNATAKVR